MTIYWAFVRSELLLVMLASLLKEQSLLWVLLLMPLRWLDAWIDVLFVILISVPKVLLMQSAKWFLFLDTWLNKELWRREVYVALSAAQPRIRHLHIITLVKFVQLIDATIHYTILLLNLVMALWLRQVHACFDRIGVTQFQNIASHVFIDFINFFLFNLSFWTIVHADGRVILDEDIA